MPIKKKEEPDVITAVETPQEFTKVEPVSEVPKGTILADLLEELKASPQNALALVGTLSKITKPWEVLGASLTTSNEVTVPSGTSAKSFIKDSSGALYVSGFKMETIFGKEVAVITKDTPKWRVTIEGELLPDVPFVQHSQKVEPLIKKFVEGKLAERGYVIGS